MSIAGLALAPVTLGTSTAFTYAGAIACGVGGITSATSSVIQKVKEKEDSEKVANKVDSHAKWEKVVHEEFKILKVCNFTSQ